MLPRNNQKLEFFIFIRIIFLFFSIRYSIATELLLGKCILLYHPLNSKQKLFESLRELNVFFFTMTKPYFILRYLKKDDFRQEHFFLDLKLLFS